MSEQSPPTQAEQRKARLQKAAPALLRAARKVHQHLMDRLKDAADREAPMPVFNGLAELRAAIWKATGKAPR